MGNSGESRGEVLRGELLATWDERRSRFTIVSRWCIRDARGDLVELIDQGVGKHVEDDEWLERTVLRLARAMVAETRALTEERSAGVQRLL